MSDSFREVTSVSWFGRIKRAVGGVLVGLVLIVAMVVLLFWNEGRAVTTARSLAEGASAVVAIGADVVDAANNGRLVHVSGPVTSDTIPSDADFGISKQAVRLIRTVEMYQWKEESKSDTTTKAGGSEETVTTYSYAKGWNSEAIDSGSFKQPDGHANPPMEIRGKQVQILEGRLGGFTLDQPVLDRIDGEKELAVSPDQLPRIDAAFGGNAKVSVVDGRIYLGMQPTAPAIGDYRIRYEYVPLGVISVIARQAGSGFAPYQTMAGDQLLMVHTGAVPAEKMFADAVSENAIITWALRLVGLVVLGIGFGLLMAPLAVIGDVVPFVGSIVRLGTGLIAFVLAVLVGTTTIAIAWFYYRPVVSIAILAVGLIVAAGIIYYGRSRSKAAGATPPNAAPAV